VRNLALRDQVGIGKAWIADDSVQLADIARPSRLCLSAETKAVQGDGAGGYVLRNGPYMRRFLDGYYPMRVTLQVNYPCGSLKVSAIHPRPQPGFRVTHGACTLGINALFEGRLRTEIRFQSPAAPDQPSKVNP